MVVEVKVITTDEVHNSHCEDGNSAVVTEMMTMMMKVDKVMVVTTTMVMTTVMVVMEMAES